MPIDFTHLIRLVVLGVIALTTAVPTAARAQATDDPSQPASPVPVPPPTPDPPPHDPSPPELEPAPPHSATDDTPVDADDTPVDPDDQPKKGKKRKKKTKPDITYSENHWLEFHGPGKQKLRFRLYLQPMLRLGHVSVIPDWTTDMIIRRGRVGFDATIQKHNGFRFEISVKNMHFEIHNMFGWWKPKKHVEIQYGFIKPPGGLERDTFSFDQPFIERSVMTFLNYDHEMGVKIEGNFDDKHWRYAAAITRDPPQLPGGDPEDSPVIPAGTESEDITRAISKWNAEARFIASPSDGFEASIRSGLRFRTDEADFGEIAVEPYDTTYLTNRPWHGIWWSTSADVAVVQPHWKAVAEGGFRRDGQQLEFPDGTAASEREVNGDHLHSWNGYFVFGYTPNGHYGPAVAAAPLKDGWELVARIQGARVNPADQAVAWMYMVEGGVHWEVSPHIRLQTDFAIEKFSHHDVTLLNENLGATRLWIQTWATLRL